MPSPPWPAVISASLGAGHTTREELFVFLALADPQTRAHWRPLQGRLAENSRSLTQASGRTPSQSGLGPRWPEILATLAAPLLGFGAGPGSPHAAAKLAGALLLQVGGHWGPVAELLAAAGLLRTGAPDAAPQRGGKRGGAGGSRDPGSESAAFGPLCRPEERRTSTREAEEDSMPLRTAKKGQILEYILR